MMYLLSIIPDTWHYMKHRPHYFIQKWWSLKFIIGKKLFEGIDQNTSSFLVLTLGAVICSIVFSFMSFRNQIITVHRYSCNLCWVHLLSCSLHFKTCLVRFFFCYAKLNFPMVYQTGIWKTVFFRGFSSACQNFGQKGIKDLWPAVCLIFTGIFIHLEHSSDVQLCSHSKTKYFRFCHVYHQQTLAAYQPKHYGYYSVPSSTVLLM